MLRSCFIGLFCNQSNHGRKWKQDTLSYLKSNVLLKVISDCLPEWRALVVLWCVFTSCRADIHIRIRSSFKKQLSL